MFATATPFLLLHLCFPSAVSAFEHFGAALARCGFCVESPLVIRFPPLAQARIDAAPANAVIGWFAEFEADDDGCREE